MWEPSNEIEHRLREALRADDQDGYFRILSQVELVLPLSYGDPSGLGGADTWATWTTDDRTHILAFTSETALSVCLRDNAGSSRRVSFAALADAWPDEEWWLAVNPGLPIEGYLPAWFVAQVAQGMTTVPADPAPPPSDPPAGDRSFASMAQSDPFANPMRPARDGGFMPAAPPVPEVPPAPRRSGNDSGSYSTVAGTTEAGLPLRQPPPGEAPASPPDPYAEQHYGSPPPASQPPAQFPEHPQWPTEQTDWPEAPDWLREQQSEPDAAQRRPAYSEPPPPTSSAPGAESFNTMSSAFSRRPAPEAPHGEPPPEPTPQAVQQHAPPPNEPAPVELTGEEAEPILAESAAKGDTAAFLQTLLCTTVVLPVADPEAVELRVGDQAFRWSSDIVDGIHGITVYTTPERLRDRTGEDAPHTTVPFGWLIRHWPGVEYALYVNPGTEVGANMSGPEIEPLLKWAEAKRLLAFAAEMERRQAAEARAAAASQRAKPVLWQKTIPHHQVSFYLERGYDRVGGFVHPAAALEHLRTPAQLYLALGLMRTSEAFSPTDDAVHVLRWTGYRTDLYPAALGGNDSPGAERNGGWIVEPGPFRGDGFAPSESPEERIPEHKVDSVRLPHGAQILRIDSRGEVTELAVFDSDTREWQPVDGAFGGPPALEAGPSAAAAPAEGERAHASGPMGEAAPGDDGGYGAAGYETSALGDAFGDPAEGHYDLVRPAEDRAAVADGRDHEWKGA